MVCRHTPHSLATSPTVRPSAMTARTALYLCSVTLISLMAGECRVGTEVAVANQPKVCSTATEGVLSPSSRTCTGRMVPRPRFELGTPAFSVRCSTKLSYLGTADDCIDQGENGVRGILSGMKKALSWLWMAGAIAALIVVQAFRQAEPLASIDAFLNGARGLIPLGIAIIIIGAGLLLGSLVHGMVFDSSPMQTGDISGRYSGPSPSGG